MSSRRVYPFVKALLKHSIVLFFTVLLVTQKSISQSTSNDGFTSIYQANSNISLVPPSPTAASFQKYGITPVDLHTGVPNISIPIYDIKAGDLSVPVSLSYHNNGLKPQDEAGWVGMGWNLNAGGCITRIQKGSPDNTRPAGQNFDDISPADSAVNTVNNQHKRFLGSVFLNQYYDTEPDIFVFNFPGHQGKFMFIKGKPYFADYERLKVVVWYDGFLITDDNGVQYYFNTYEYTRPYIKTDQWANSGGTINTWHLTKIVSADQQHWINFTYTSYTMYQSNRLVSETYKTSFGEAFANFVCVEAGGGGYTDTKNFQHASDVIYGQSLSSITTSEKQVIKFNQSAATRTDVGTSENALGNIVVYGQTGNPDTVITKVAFAYDYFTNSAYPTSPNYARLKLRGMYNLSATNDTLNNYAFAYENEFDNFPDKNNVGTDTWGYYNRYADATESLFPTIFFYTEGYNTGLPPLFKATVQAPANKAPNYTFAKYGVLNKITYPTGGYTTFTYEQNKYAFYNPDNSNLTDNQRVQLYKDTAFPMTTFNTLNDPHADYGTSKSIKIIKIDTVTTVYLACSRTLWDSLSYPVNTFNFPVYIAKYTPTSCVLDDPNNPCDTVNVFTSPVKFRDSVYERSDSVVLQPGLYRITLYCDNKSFKTDLGVKYKLRIPNAEADGPGLRVATVSNYDGIQTNPVSQKSYVYTDSLGKASGVLNEVPHYQVLETEGNAFAPHTENGCGSVDYLQYVFTTDNNAVYNANLNFLYYYYAVKEYTAPTQSNTYYSEHYYKPLLMPAPPSKSSVAIAPAHFGEWNYEDILLSSEPVETKTISWLNKGATGYQKQSETNTTYNYTLDQSAIGIRPISIRDENSGEIPIEYTGWTFDKYTIFCLWKYPVSKQEIMYDTLGTSMTTTTNFSYSSRMRQLIRTEQTVNNGKTIITKIKYPADYSGTDNSNGLMSLAGANIWTPVVETQIWQKSSSTDSSILKGVVTDYDKTYYKPNKKYFLFNVSPFATLNNETHDEDAGGFNTLLSDTRYSEKMRMSYDKRGNVMEVITDSGMNVPTSYVWGYYGLYPVAKVVGARFSSVVSQIDTAAIQSITDDSLLRVALAPLRGISGAQATIYTYAPFVGMTSTTDINGRTSYFEYDNYNRLLNIRDINKYVLKSYAYQYAGLNALPTSNSTPPTNATISVVNSTGLTGFTASFTSTATSAVTSYSIPAAGGVLSPVLAPGNYNISISKSGNSLSFIYSINCSSLSQQAVSASFSNVAVSATSCNTITISSDN